MRKLALLLVVLALASCTEVVTISPPPPPPNVRAYNSAWEVVAEDYAVGSRSAAPADLAAYVEDYNAAHTDDQLHLVYGEEVVPVEMAPDADAWIVSPTDHAVLAEYLDIERSDLSDRRETWRAQAYSLAGVLFVDRIPPPPAPPPIVTDYERYALYLIDSSGAILHETHCEDWEPGYASRAECYEITRQSWAAAAYSSGWTLIAGRLYTPPEAGL